MTNWWIFYLIGLKEPKQDGCQTQDNKKNKLIKLRKRFTTPNQLLRKASNLPAMTERKFILNLSLHNTIKRILVTQPEQKTVRQLEIITRTAFDIPLTDKDYNPLGIRLTRKSTGQEINKKNDSTELQLSSFDFQDEEFIMVSVWRATSKGDACNDSLCKQLTLNDSTSSNMPQKRLILRLCLHGRVKKIRITNPELRTVQQLESIARTAFKIPLLDENKNFIEIELTRRSTGEIINRREHFAIMYLSSFAFQDDEFIMVRVRIFQ